MGRACVHHGMRMQQRSLCCMLGCLFIHGKGVLCGIQNCQTKRCSLQQEVCTVFSFQACDTELNVLIAVDGTGS